MRAGRQYRDPDRADRALKLLEQGLSYVVIAERLGVSRSSVDEMLRRAKEKRAGTSESADG